MSSKPFISSSFANQQETEGNWKEILLNSYKSEHFALSDSILQALLSMIQCIHKIIPVTHHKKGFFNKFIISCFTAQTFIECIHTVLLSDSETTIGKSSSMSTFSEKLADYIGKIMVECKMIEFDCQDKNSVLLSDDKKRMVRFLHPYMPRMVIVGGGHAGLMTACQLSEYYSIILIDTNKNCTLKPAYPVIIEKLEHADKISVNYSNVLPSNVTFIQGTVKQVKQEGVFIDLIDCQSENKYLFSDNPEDSLKYLTFDYLVISTGCNGWKSLPSYESDEENKIFYVDGYNMDMVKESVHVINQSNVSIVVIGGGSVGCEYFGSLAQSFPKKKVYLIQKSDMLMKPSKDANKVVLNKFSKFPNANIMLNSHVKCQYDSNTLIIENESGEEISIKCSVCFLATGCSPNTNMMKLYFSSSFDEHEFLKVNSHFQLESKPNSPPFKNIFVLGDANNADSEKLIQNANFHAEKFVEIAKTVLLKDNSVLPQYESAPRVMAVSLGPKYGLLMKENKIMFKSGMVNKLKSAIQSSTLKSYAKYNK